MKIAILGGSFNPVHKGHINIARYAIKELQLDKLLFVPAYKSPFKRTILANANHRIKMLEFNLEPKMEISDFEIKRRGVSYTIETVRFFKQKYPRASIFVIIGSDLLYKLNKWREIKTIIDLAKIVVFKRTTSWTKINLKKYNCKLLNNEIYPYSSSKFKNGDFSHLEPQVQKYIGKNRLYVKDLIMTMTNPNRYKHSLAVAQFAVKLAKLNNFDVKKTWLAAIFHDVTKNWNTKEHQTFLEKYNIDPQVVANYNLHSLTGSIWLDKVYQINDREIISAVRKHTSLAKELSLLDKIVFAADKLCAGRKYEGIQEDRKLIFKDFAVGFQNIVKKTSTYLKKHHSLTKEQIAIYEEWS